MYLEDTDPSSDPQPSPRPRLRFIGLRRLLRSFIIPETNPSAIPPDLDTEPQPPRSDSPIDNEETGIKDRGGTESVASPTPLQRSRRHTRTKTTDPEELPPSRWLAPEPGTITKHAGPSPTLSRSGSTAADELETVPPVPTNLITPTEGVPDPTLLSEERPTPTHLAQRIHSIIASAPTTTHQPMVLESPTTPGDRRTFPQSPVQGPSNLLSPMAGLNFLSFLYSPRLVGSPALGQPSIFPALERLQSPMARNPELPPEDGPNGNGGQDNHRMEVVENGSSLMLCSPLIPQRDSLVEIAETEYISLDEAGRAIAGHHRSPLHQVHMIDVINEGEGTSQAPGEGTVKNNAVDGEGQPSNGSGAQSEGVFAGERAGREAKEEKKQTGAKAKQRKFKGDEKLMWVPSPTELSLQTMWWGYRIYLPPPVLEVLDNKQLEATKRAAMVTSALGWLLDNIPVEQIPSQFQLALSLLRGLVPLLGYIGGFIAWSWSAIRAFDQGCGVTLTATWLLPIAIIPGTWKVYEDTKGQAPS